MSIFIKKNNSLNCKIWWRKNMCPPVCIDCGRTHLISPKFPHSLGVLKNNSKYLHHHHQSWLMSQSPPLNSTWSYVRQVSGRDFSPVRSRVSPVFSQERPVVASLFSQERHVVSLCLVLPSCHASGTHHSSLETKISSGSPAWQQRTFPWQSVNFDS